MQTGLGYPLEGGGVRLRSQPWAVILFFGFLFTMLSQLAMIEFTQGADGRWIAAAAAEPQQWVVWLILTITAVSVLASAAFLWHRWREWRTGTAGFSWRDLTGADLIYTCAWLQLCSTCYLVPFQLFLPYPLFAQGSVAGMLESAYLQVLILLIFACRFRGRGWWLGLRLPRHPWRMLAAVLLMMVLILFAMDQLVTNPLADWLNLSLESEREKLIEQEILQAKAHHPVNVLASIAVIGLLVPLAEELLFRGLIQSYLVKRWGAFLGILVSSLWFALLHIDLALFVPLLLIGLALGYVRHHFDSLWAAVVLHSLNNLASVLYYFW